MRKVKQREPTSHSDVYSLLKKTVYGLAPDEVSKKIGVSAKNTKKLLDEMAHDKKITKTKAGRTFFYRLITVILLAAIIAPSYAQELTSTNYKIAAEIIDAAGGNVTSSSNRTMLLSLSPVSSVRSSETYEFCAGFLCNFLDIVSVGKVTFMLSFNLEGSAGDQSFVDNFTEQRRYEPDELKNYYVCTQDISLSGGPVSGIIFAGSKLNYIKSATANSFNIRVAQEIPGNKFIIPVTTGNCMVLNPRMPQIAQYGTILQPFVIFNEAVNAVELALDYRAFDISGTFDKSGPFTIVIEKNLTNENQIIIKPE